MTRSELAKLCGTSVSTIARYEDNKVKNYNMDLLANISIALHISINKLLMNFYSPERDEKYDKLIKD